MRAEHVAWITGEQAPNRTDVHWAVGGTDLGICWDDGRGGVLVAFGDTFNPRASGGGGGGGDWRSNVLARSCYRDLSTGLPLTWFAADRPGHAREILASRKLNGTEITTIPTGGCSVGKRNYIAYMSVKDWGDPGRWRTNYAGLAHSDDGGRTWVKPTGPGTPTWGNTPNYDQRFQMPALVRHDGYVYLPATPNGRAGPAYLARAPEGQLTDLSTHRQWDGRGWISDQWKAQPILPAPVSELSVMYHRASGLWLAAYYRESDGDHPGSGNAIVVHTAAAITGPWSAPQPVASAADYPALYGAFWHPWTADDPDPCFLMSQWVPYNAELMRLRLADTSAAFQLLNE